MGCIYMWTNQVNKKGYIGKSHGDVMDRYKDHVRGRGSKLLKRAINKYGIENFTFEILHDGILDTFLDDYERQAIKEYNTLVPHGYNLTEGGEGSLGFRHSEETRRRISQAHKGKTYSEETRRKMSEAQSNRSEETRQKLSKALTGKSRSEATRRKISETQRGEKHYLYGKKHKTETIQKMSEAKRGEKHPMYGVRGERHHHYGKSRPEETRRKISKSLKRPEYYEAQKFFCSLSSDIPTIEKWRQLSAKYPDIPKGTKYDWFRQWQSVVTS